MGVTATYIEESRLYIKAIKGKRASELSNMFERLYTDETLKVFHLEKMWDGFHYFLTGISATHMMENGLMENSLLSEAVLGSDGLGDEGISWIYPERVKEIAAALEAVDTEEKLEEFSLSGFEENDIYVMSEADIPEGDLKQEMLDIFEGFKEFFCHAADNKKGVVILFG